MRWWLSGMFVLIAVVTAVLVATVSSRQTSQALQANSEDLAVGKTVSAAFAVENAIPAGRLRKAADEAAARRGIALFVFAPDGSLLTSSTSLGIEWHSISGRGAALRAALTGHRYVRSSGAGGATLAGLPLRRTSAAAALVSYAPRPAAYRRSLVIFRRETVRAALCAVLAAAAVGLLAAALVARRLRRIDAAAAAIERGDFDVEMRPRLHDEVGSLAENIDRMRRRLRTSFEQLQRERDRLGRLFEQLHEGVVAVDAKLVVRFANRTTAALAGAKLRVGEPLPEQWLGMPVRELVRGLFRPDAAVAQSQAETTDGRIVSLVGVPAGGAELAVLVLTDVTEQERRERAEREFVANASHELRTPVSAILAAVEALRAGAQESGDERELFVALIERQATRLGRLIRSLLLLAQAQTQQGELQLEPVELQPLLDDVARSSVAPDGVEVAVACPPGLTALAQRDVAEQVVSNLLENALKHSTHGTVRLAGRRENGHVVLEVLDEGPGIAADTQGRIFDRFYSGGGGGRRDGFGLGLAIVREAVRALGGEIEIESEPGRGTSARVTLAAAGTDG